MLEEILFNQNQFYLGADVTYKVTIGLDNLDESKEFLYLIFNSVGFAHPKAQFNEKVWSTDLDEEGIENLEKLYHHGMRTLSIILKHEILMDGRTTLGKLKLKSEDYGSYIYDHVQTFISQLNSINLDFTIDSVELELLDDNTNDLVTWTRIYDFEDPESYEEAVETVAGDDASIWDWAADLPIGEGD